MGLVILESIRAKFFSGSHSFSLYPNMRCCLLRNKNAGKLAWPKSVRLGHRQAWRQANQDQTHLDPRLELVIGRETTWGRML